MKKRIFGKTKELAPLQLIELLKNKKLSYIKLILLFGSRAENKHHCQSDYDFAIFAEEDVKYPWGVIAQVWNDMGDILDLPDYDYDIVDLKYANSCIVGSIKENYILLKGDEDELQRLFTQYD